MNVPAEIVDAIELAPYNSHLQEIIGHHQAACNSILATGEALLAAKADLSHGEYQAMFADSEMPFTYRQGQRYTSLVGHPLTKDMKRLPKDISTLSELARLSNEEYQAALEADEITPEMTARDVGRLVKRIARDDISKENHGDTRISGPKNDDDGTFTSPDALIEHDANIEGAEHDANLRAASTSAYVECFSDFEPDQLTVVAQAVAARFGIDAAHLYKEHTYQGAERRRIVRARSIICYIYSTEYGKSYDACASPFGLDPSTMTSMLSRVEVWRDVEEWQTLIDGVIAYCRTITDPGQF